MSKKNKNRNLIFIFALLLIAVGINQIIRSNRGERTFRKDIVEIKAEEISKISIFPKNAEHKNIEITLNDTVWDLKFDGKTYVADQEMIRNIADELASMKPEQLVANKRDLWKDYDISDSAGIKVMISGKKNEKTELTLGRFTYNQATRKPTTYVRVDNEKEVYAVEGYLSMTFNRDISSLRDKNIFRGNPNDLKVIKFTYPADSSFTLSRLGSGWTLDGTPVDSARMAGFLSMASYLVGIEFRDDFNPALASPETFMMTLSGDGMEDVEIKVYRDAQGSVINSSLNKTSFFSADKPEIFKRVFVGKRFFIKPD